MNDTNKLEKLEKLLPYDRPAIAFRRNYLYWTERDGICRYNDPDLVSRYITVFQTAQITTNIFEEQGKDGDFTSAFFYQRVLERNWVKSPDPNFRDWFDAWAQGESARAGAVVRGKMIEANFDEAYSILREYVLELEPISIYGYDTFFRTRYSDKNELYEGKLPRKLNSMDCKVKFAKDMEMPLLSTRHVNKEICRYWKRMLWGLNTNWILNKDMEGELETIRTVYERSIKNMIG